MKRKFLVILAFILVFSLGYRIFIYYYLSASNKTAADRGKYFLYQFSLSRSISFADEKIPLEDAQVRDRFVHLLINNTFEKTQTLMLHKQSARWFPLIEGILRKYKVPDDFKYLALVESGFGNNVSAKGASGFWQFIPSTAMHYGLEINNEVDERHDPERATIAACKYIKDCYKKFNNWTLTAASYNMGPEALQKEMNRQKEKSYYDLILNRETSEYLFKILVMKEIVTRPVLYGYKFNRRQFNTTVPSKNVIVDSSITDLHTFAAYHQTTVSFLKFMNPWLTGNSLHNPTHKKYCFKIMKPGFENSAGLTILPDSVLQEDSIPGTTDSMAK